MPLQIAIPFVDDALGNSVVYEEYKGDLAQASQIADEKLSDARQQRDPATLADALLARGVVYLLQGEPPAATIVVAVPSGVPPESGRCNVACMLGSGLTCCKPYSI